MIAGATQAEPPKTIEGAASAAVKVDDVEVAQPTTKNGKKA
jgi:hypothetical protein